jgi:hypothetical protein
MTAYRQQALACAAKVRLGLQRPRDLKPLIPDAPKILHRNVYGWFKRTARGVYALTEAGHAALQKWPQPGEQNAHGVSPSAYPAVTKIVSRLAS